MRVYSKESKRLKQAQSFLSRHFPDYGVNKKQEITRLLYEISKRENILPSKIIEHQYSPGYDTLKKELLERRYPLSYSSCQSLKPHLPKIELNPHQAAILKKRRFYPKDIFIEEKASQSALASRLKEFFPKANFKVIGSLKEYMITSAACARADYNKRRERLFIVNEKYDFFKPCPCTASALNCGYHIFNLGFGCIFECNYCFLQDYTNVPGIILTANIEKFFDEFSRYKRNGMRLGTGEFSDSLALDDITGYAMPLVEFFKGHKEVIFEFKTKSIQVKNLLKLKPAGNIVVSWSINPQQIIEENEFLTPSLSERLAAARACAQAGYRIGFHFDPILYYDGWEGAYAQVVETIFEAIHPKDIAWISLGTFRFSRGLRQVIERRFPQNTILNEELLLGYDHKLRYPYRIRYVLYKKMLELLSEHLPKFNIYLCMEEALMWKELKLDASGYLHKCLTRLVLVLLLYLTNDATISAHNIGC